MIKINVEHDSFKHNDFIIDVFKNVNGFHEAWIKHEDYGVSMLMFGIDANEFTYSDCLEIVESNIEEYIPTYVEQYMD